MLNANDQENAVKSSHAANLLVQDLRELVVSSNPLLAEIAIELLHNITEIEQKLSRLILVTKP